MVLPLQNSFLLDSASNVHVCNDRSRYHIFYNADETAGVYAGGRFMRTLGTGEIWIDCTGTNGNNVKSLLTDVHYIPDFHTNLISYDRLEMNGIYWDS